MTRILFVDDDKNILQGISRMLRPMKNEWQLTFAQSGEEALNIIGQEIHDVIISDTHMPGMNGIELLKKVREFYPDVIRIGLSGHNDEGLALLSTKITHQQLLKPCNPENLKDAICKAIRMRKIVSNKELNRIITEIDSLPALPELYHQITEIIESKDGSLKEVADVISRDFAMTAKILQLVNSAFFGLARHVKSPEEAVMYLGYDVIRGLVITIKIFSELDCATHLNLNLDRLWDQGILNSSIASHIAGLVKLDKKSRDYAQMAGMLQDIGILLLATNLPEKYNEVLKLQSETGENISRAEEQVFGCTHSEVGGTLLGIWGLPDQVVDAVAYHHCPWLSDTQGITPLTVVHIANILYWRNVDPGYPVNMNEEYFEKLGVRHRLETWNESVREKYFDTEQVHDRKQGEC